MSAGHDGLYPYERHPYDEVYVIAYRGSASLADQYVELHLPHYKKVTLYNTSGIRPEFRVHRSGFLWHDRVREIPQEIGVRWLSVYGFTHEDPRTMGQPLKELLAVLPGSPMKDSFLDLIACKKWRITRDFHTRNREWMPKERPVTSRYESLKIERDSSLVTQLKRDRGSKCQICGFTFKKLDGTDYCEVHHLESLADGGLDVAANCVVLCANCHRRFHYGVVRVVSHTAHHLVVCIDGDKYICNLV